MRSCTSESRLNKPVDFYEPTGINGWLSNFSAHPIILSTRTWPTVEHFYQAQKFQSGSIREEIAAAATPGAAKALGSKFKDNRRSDWRKIRVLIMYVAVAAKFRQHAELRHRLLLTGRRPIREMADDDSYWGVGRDTMGANRLGVLLMKLREQIRREVTS